MAIIPVLSSSKSVVAQSVIVSNSFSAMSRFFIVLALLSSVLGLDPPSYFMEEDDHVKQVYHAISKLFILRFVDLARVSTAVVSSLFVFTLTYVCFD